MVPVGDKPILWNLMHYYSQFGHKDFVLCLGYKANVTNEYFLNYKPRTYADCAVSGSSAIRSRIGRPSSSADRSMYAGVRSGFSTFELRAAPSIALPRRQISWTHRSQIIE